MNVLEIVREYLTAHGYDGLYNEDGDCACYVRDLNPCSYLSSNCKAGDRLDDGKGEIVGIKDRYVPCPDCDGEGHVPAPALVNSASEEPMFRTCPMCTGRRRIAKTIPYDWKP